jgi:hypothetical protein
MANLGPPEILGKPALCTRFPPDFLATVSKNVTYPIAPAVDAVVRRVAKVAVNTGVPVEALEDEPGIAGTVGDPVRGHAQVVFKDAVALGWSRPGVTDERIVGAAVAHIAGYGDL